MKNESFKSTYIDPIDTIHPIFSSSLHDELIDMRIIMIRGCIVHKTQINTKKM